MNPSEILNPQKRRKSNAYLVNKLREAIYAWRKQDYAGSSETTKRLLHFWFDEDHTIDTKDANITPFEFWFAQRESIETLIYIKEVLKNTRFVDLAKEFGAGPMFGYDPSVDIYSNYAFKMATGSGKTFVMAMAVVWAYFNNKFENEAWPSKFLIIAPNIIVYERLKRDFEAGKIFNTYPFIPPEFKDAFAMNVVLREDPITAVSENTIFLTNIQQLQEREQVNDIDSILKLQEVDKDNLANTNRIREVLIRCPNIMILKDEAHHIYHLEKSWKKILLKLNENLIERHGTGIWAELDFSATPKTEVGTLFPWIIADFSLQESIEMNISKRPLKGELKGARELNSTVAHERYKAWVDAGIRRWREYRKSLEPVGKKPILFIMCEDTNAANDIYEYVNGTSELKNKVLLIHTKLNGDIVDADLATAREAAKSIDDGERYQAIISVMMLNEGWDVKNVTVVVGLRSYSSKRKVLPEQVIGRGLRKMFPDQPAGNYVNMLEVIGPKGLTDILDKLKTEEGIELATFDVNEPINITTILVEQNKLGTYDLGVPVLSPRVSRTTLDLSNIKVKDFKISEFKLQKTNNKTKYVATDMLTEKEVISRKWTLPVPQNSRSVIAYYTHKILKLIRVPDTTNFPVLYGLVKDYVRTRMFNGDVDLDDPRVLSILSEPQVEDFLLKMFSDKMKKISIKQSEPTILKSFKLSDTAPFVWSRPVYPAKRSVLNYQPCGNNLELKFCKFLDEAEDIKAFMKMPERKTELYVEYLATDETIHPYFPDFIAKTNKGEVFIIETKGLEDLNVKRKDERAKIWCEDLSKLTKSKWNFIRVNQKFFESHAFNSFYELLDTQKKA